MDALGIYLAEAESGFLSEANNGTARFEMKWKITKKAENGAWVDLTDGESMERTSYWSFSGKAEKHTLAKLDKVGFDGNYDVPKFADIQHQIECTHSTYEGSTRSDWDFPWDGESKPASDGVKTLMTAKWKNKHQGDAAPPPATPPGPPDESIPF